MPRDADCAWLALAAGVIVYDLCASDGEKLSEGADRYMLTHPWITRMVVAITAAHLLNLLPQMFDPFYRAAILRKTALSSVSWGRLFA